MHMCVLCKCMVYGVLCTVARVCYRLDDGDGPTRPVRAETVREDEEPKLWCVWEYECCVWRGV
jgi:hypothetical protein